MASGLFFAEPACLAVSAARGAAASASAVAASALVAAGLAEFAANLAEHAAVAASCDLPLAAHSLPAATPPAAAAPSAAPPPPTSLAEELREPAGWILALQSAVFSVVLGAVLPVVPWLWCWIVRPREALVAGMESVTALVWVVFIYIASITSK